MLHVQDLSFGYDSAREVVSDVSLDIHRGEICYLCGPSGSGKTTLCLLLAGILKPKAGTILLTPDKSPRATMTLQFAEELFLTDSVHEEVELIEDASSIARVRSYIDSVGLPWRELKDRHPLALSFGQSRLLAIAIQCAHDTPIYIFDEPTLGLDEINMIRVAEFVRELSVNGRTIIVVTHDSELIATLPGSVALMKDGRSVWRGSSSEFLASSSLKSSAAFE